MAQPNCAFNHLALSVPNIDEAVEWYTKLFGFRVIVPTMLAESNGPTAQSTAKIYGPELKAMKMCILSMGNGVAFEIFEYIDPKYNGPEKRIDWNRETYTKGGVFHICVTVIDVDVKTAECIGMGAKQVGETVVLTPSYRAAYLQDPWGNVVELLNCSMQELFLELKAIG